LGRLTRKANEPPPRGAAREGGGGAGGNFYLSSFADAGKRSPFSGLVAGVGVSPKVRSPNITPVDFVTGGTAAFIAKYEIRHQQQ
jgi:hypothetical protein